MLTMAQSEERRGGVSELPRSAVHLPRKPETPLCFGLARGHGKLAETHLVVFLNGLIGTQIVWDETVEKLLASWNGERDSATDDGPSTGHPSLLTYDRYGQGPSGRDPTDDPEFGHGLPEVVADLKGLVVEIWQQQLGFELPSEPDPTPQSDATGQQARQSEWLQRLPRLVFVANSIGCVIGRYFAQTYPGTVSALLFLDSNIANTDQVSLFPDPDAPGFDPGALPDGVTVPDLRDTRAKYLFHPSVRNPENLDRRNIAELLPDADKPHLVGPGSPPSGHGHDPWITVVGHDPVKFADDCANGSLQSPRALTNAYVNPAWARYNEGLTKLTDEEKRTGPLIAERCGHFIQVDDPGLVAGLVRDLLEKLGDGSSSDSLE